MPPINGESHRLTLAWSIPGSLLIVANVVEHVGGLPTLST